MVGKIHLITVQKDCPDVATEGRLDSYPSQVAIMAAAYDISFGKAILFYDFPHLREK